MTSVEIELDVDGGQMENTRSVVNLSQTKATWVLGGFQLLLLILMGVKARGPDNVTPSPGTTQAYNMFIGVEIMMFVGFGYLMTFLKHYGLGAVGFTMIVTAMALQWAVFTEAFWYQVWENDFDDVSFNMYSLLNSLYTVSAVLITFGAIVGKVTPVQLIVVTIIELFCHSFNYKILMEGVMKFQDMGGTYIDHMFGAYFGLAVAWVLGKPREHQNLWGGHIPDTFSFIGVLFLWIYWPSFVGGAATADSAEQSRALVNTIISLSGSTVATFILSSIMSTAGRFRPVDIQNATLAGGVAIGSIANLQIGPFDACITGISGGLVSTYGFNVILPYLEENLGIHDSCGVHNLHALPSLVGALASVIVQGYKGTQDDVDPRQWWYQLLAMPLCIVFAIVAGIVTGYILKLFDPTSPDDVDWFRDDAWWEVAEDFGSDHDVNRRLEQKFDFMDKSKIIESQISTTE